MMIGEVAISSYGMAAAQAIGATPAKTGGPVGKYLYDIDLVNGALAALRAVHFEELCTALDDVCLLACRSDLAPDEDWNAAVEAGMAVLKKIRGEA